MCKRWHFKKSDFPGEKIGLLRAAVLWASKGGVGIVSCEQERKD
jgi:hypothetical protein